MKQSPYWECNSHSATQEIPHPLLNPIAHYRVHKNPPPVPTLSQMNPIHILKPYLPNIILILFSHLHLVLWSGLLLSESPTKILYVFLISPMRATRPTYLILLDLSILTVFVEECKLWSSSLCSFRSHFCPDTSSLLGPNILLSTLFSNTINLCSFLNVRDKVSYP
jgi:hypothetical protein